MRPPSVAYAELEAIKEGLRIVLDKSLEIHEVNTDSS